MAKDKSDLSKEERRALKAEKKASKTLTEESGVKKSKTEKKDKKKREALAEKALNEINGTAPTTGEDEGEVKNDDEMDTANKKLAMRPVGALVPFANPLADEKVAKKVFKSVKKAAGQRTLKRGVKEVVKALRKSPTSAPPSSMSADSSSLPIGIVVLAADISPMDVISHIPILCEDHNIPYIFVTSRAELGMAGQTKRPTSVVMVSRDVVKKKADETADEGEEWAETYKSLVKAILKETPQARR